MEAELRKITQVSASKVLLMKKRTRAQRAKKQETTEKTKQNTEKGQQKEIRTKESVHLSLDTVHESKSVNG